MLAEEALQFGLVNHVVAHDDLHPVHPLDRHRHLGNDQDGVRQIRATYDEITHDDDGWEKEARDSRMWQRHDVQPGQGGRATGGDPGPRQDAVTTTGTHRRRLADPTPPRPRPRRGAAPSAGPSPSASSSLTGAILAINLHRNGHNQGDDFALYLRQARSIFDGDTAQVVADNRFAVLNSDVGFSPIAYPWGFPLLLSPFVKQWGLDYGRLKLVEVACFCTWIVLVHGIVRRRVGRGVAIAIAAVLATAPVLLLHTDQLLSEYPHAMVLGVWVWWLDHVLRRRAR